MRPFDFTKEVVEHICGELAGGRSIRDICNDPGMPSEPTIYRRMSSDGNFAELIAKARTAQQEFEADQCVLLADSATTANWQVIKLQIWARQWRAGKLAPKKYGDRTAIDLAGSLDIGKLSTDELKAELAALIGAQQVTTPKQEDDGNDGSDLV